MERRLSLSLLSLRWTVFVAMSMWTLDKFVNPVHASGVFENFYGLPGLGAAPMLAIAVGEGLLLLAFVAGLARTWTYGLVLLLHAVSTLSSFGQYLAPFEHLLFFAAWPMLAACLTLFLLREQDRLWTWPVRRRNGP